MSYEGFGFQSFTITFYADGNPLIPGRLYIMITDKPEYDKRGNPTGETYESAGCFFWYGSNGTFYDADSEDFEDISHYDYDRVVLQSGNVNKDFV